MHSSTANTHQKSWTWLGFSLKLCRLYSLHIQKINMLGKITWIGAKWVFRVQSSQMCRGSLKWGSRKRGEVEGIGDKLVPLWKILEAPDLRVVPLILTNWILIHLFAFAVFVYWLQKEMRAFFKNLKKCMAPKNCGVSSIVIQGSQVPSFPEEVE